jgi:hypothetical protein
MVSQMNLTWMAHDLSPSGSLRESLGVIELRYTGWPALPPDMFPFCRIVEAQLRWPLALLAGRRRMSRLWKMRPAKSLTAVKNQKLVFISN